MQPVLIDTAAFLAATSPARSKLVTKHLHCDNAGSHAYNDAASWWRAEPGYQAGTTWFVLDKTVAGRSGPAVVDDFGDLVRANYVRPTGVTRA